MVYRQVSPLIRRSLSSLFVACVAVFFCPASAQDDPRQTGPLALIIQYRFPPAKRPEVHQRMLSSGLRNFDRWQADGVLSGHRLFFSRYVDLNGWDLMAVLQFRQYTDVARWRRVEAASPAGLSPDVISLATSVETYPVDTIRFATSEQRPAHPVFFAIPYTITIAPDAYLRYFDEYVKPQFEGWMREGVLSEYQLMMQRYTASRPWDVLIVLTYKDEESFGLRESVVVKVRAQLEDDPVWKAASNDKRNVRVERQAIIADELVAP
jgi:hypothetical protein